MLLSAMPTQSAPLGYLYNIPLSTVTVAGGVNELLDLFAGRARAYFRGEGIACHTFVSYRFVEMRLPQDDFGATVLGFRHEESNTPDFAQISLTDFHAGPWTPLHEAFAALVAEWPEITARREIPQPPPAPSDFTDEQLAQARAIIIADRRATTSYVQRKLQIGYSRAAGIIERLEQDGVISAPNHAGKREVLVDA